MDKEKVVKYYDGQIEGFEKVIKDAGAAIESLEWEKDDHIRKLEILEKYGDNPPKNKEELGELFSVLCFGSPAWCCRPNGFEDAGYGGASKTCPFRDGVLKCLGISKKEFVGIKQNVNREIASRVIKQDTVKTDNFSAGSNGKPAKTARK